MASSVLISKFQQIPSMKQMLVNPKPKKFTPVTFRCLWDGVELQVTTHKHEKKEKDYCGAYCNRAYYDMKKRLNLSFQSTNKILETSKGQKLRTEIIQKLEAGEINGKDANRQLIEGAKLIKRNMAEKRKFKLKSREKIQVNY